MLKRLFRWWALVVRAVTIVLLLMGWVGRLAVRLLIAALRPRGMRGARVREQLAVTLTDAVEQLGPAYVKLGQVLSTRVDLLPPWLCRNLSRLHDRVSPPSDLAAVIRTVPPLVTSSVIGGAAGLTPAAAGSIACVYRACLYDGRVVAIKVRRPGIEQTMRLDLALVGAVARVVGRLPAMRQVPLAEIVDQVSAAVYEQLNFVREAQSLTQLRENLSCLPDVRVPAVVSELSGHTVLVMEWIGALERSTEQTPARRTAMLNGLRAAYQMLFQDGFVHCDLHPGNLYLMSDGTAVIVDTGFVRGLTDLTRRRFAEFFYYLVRSDGQRCAEILLSTALDGRGRYDRDGFREDVVALVARNSSVRASDFDLASFAATLFAIQRARGLYADPQFVFPILALLVLEGSVRELVPDVDFQAEAVPYVLRGLQETASVRRG
ncbi:ABC1 kinase family protein [Salinispora fenicalii]|uniref:ABC1 kinase family protein n=1 Tax=Salinispora fenicalii TaxID=1137263 RepID=UPI000489452B|nr:AarF/UbiB family protein [Salinispora fenicalii]